MEFPEDVEVYAVDTVEVGEIDVEEIAEDEEEEEIAEDEEEEEIAEDEEEEEEIAEEEDEEETAEEEMEEVLASIIPAVERAVDNSD